MRRVGKTAVSSYYADLTQANATCLNTSKHLTVVARRLKVIGLHEAAQDIATMSLRLNSYAVSIRDMERDWREFHRKPI